MEGGTEARGEGRSEGGRERGTVRSGKHTVTKVPEHYINFLRPKENTNKRPHNK